jgi:hypothetical protein
MATRLKNKKNKKKPRAFSPQKNSFAFRSFYEQVIRIVVNSLHSSSLKKSVHFFTLILKVTLRFRVALSYVKVPVCRSQQIILWTLQPFILWPIKITSSSSSSFAPSEGDDEYSWYWREVKFTLLSKVSGMRETVPSYNIVIFVTSFPVYTFQHWQWNFKHTSN